MFVLEGERKYEERESREAAQILAKEFARERGRTYALTPFSLEQLSRRSNKIRPKEDTILGGCDLNFYRERASRRPAAIAIHIANPDLAALEEIATRFNLRVEVVEDFPAWMDGARLIVYRPPLPSEGPKQRKARKGRSCLRQLALPFK